MASIKEYWRSHKTFRRVIGVILILIGFISLVTPLTPGSWLIVIGLEIIGVRILFLDKIKSWFNKKSE